MATVHPLDQPPKRNDPSCEDCDLYKSSLTVCCPSVIPDGQVQVAVFAEALGEQEAEVGIPLVGNAGKKFDYYLRKAGIDREDLFIGNVVRCRPPSNRKPKKTEQVACGPYLLYDILKHKPKAILAMGATACSILIRDWETSTKVNGKSVRRKKQLKKWRGFPTQETYTYVSKKGRVHTHTCWVIPTFHPSAALRESGGALSGWSLDEIVTRDIALAQEYAEGKEGLVWPNTKVHVAETLDQALRLIRRVGKVGRASVDLETTGKDPHKDQTLCIGFCWKEGESWVLPMLQQYAKPFWNAEEKKTLLKALTKLFRKLEIIGQGFKFDIKFLRKLLGIEEFKVVFDTMVSHHVLNENAPHNLTFQCQWYLRWNKYDSLMDAYKSDNVEAGNYGDAPNDVLWNYLGFDVDGSLRLSNIHRPLLKKEKCNRVFQIELALTNPLADVEYRGFTGDKQYLVDLAGDYEKRIEKTLKSLRRTATTLLGEEKGNEFNPNSAQQVADLLQGAGAVLTKRTPGGAFSVNDTVLSGIALKKTKAGSIAKRVQDMRSFVRTKSTYLDGKNGDGGMAACIAEDGRVHASFNIALTRTGRLSCSEPNLQNIPRVGGLRFFLRPDDPKHALLAVDYEKVELCCMAWRANDEVMVRELTEGIDLHTRMACTVRLSRDPTDEEFERLAPEISKDERSLAKGVNFGIPYGRQAYSIVEANPDNFPLKMPKRNRIMKVERMVEAYFEKYYGVYEFMERQVRTAVKRRYLRAYFSGRKRRFDGVDWFLSPEGKETSMRDHDFAHLKREAQNFEIQAMASDELTKATARAFQGIKDSGIPGFRIVLTLHDALVFNVPQEHVVKAAELIKGWMETTLEPDKKHKYRMPLRVDIDPVRRWSEGEYESDFTKDEIAAAKESAKKHLERYYDPGVGLDTLTALYARDLLYGDEGLWVKGGVDWA